MSWWKTSIKNTILSLNASQAPEIFSTSWTPFCILLGHFLYPFGTPFNEFANVVPTIKNFSKKLTKIISFTYITTCEYLRIWGKYLITSSKWFHVYKFNISFPYFHNVLIIQEIWYSTKADSVILFWVYGMTFYRGSTLGKITWKIKWTLAGILPK